MVTSYNIACIVPLVSETLFKKAFDIIESSGGTRPDWIIYDNTPDGHKEQYKGARIIRGPIGFNKTLNFAKDFCCDYDLMTFLNDDVLVEPDFFTRIVWAFRTLGQRCFVVCPETVSRDMNLWYRITKQSTSSTYDQMTKREGWSFTIRADVYQKIPAIPDKEFETFFGDDWLWHFTSKNWYKDYGNIIFHKVGVSCKLLDKRKHLDEERAKFNAAIMEYER